MAADKTTTTPASLLTKLETVTLEILAGLIMSQPLPDYTDPKGRLILVGRALDLAKDFITTCEQLEKKP